jgi:uncharacterized protein
MTTTEIMEKMIVQAEGNVHDVNHFLKVHAFARLIGLREGLDAPTLKTLEAAAIVHDIACPLCRRKYGNTNGKRQEEEGMPLVRQFFSGTDLESAILERVVYLVGHHHTLRPIDGADYQILIEADYLVNAYEKGFSQSNIRNVRDRIFRTDAGRALLEAMYLV